MSTSKLGEEGLKFLMDAFEKIKGLKDTDTLKNIIEHIENIQTLAEEKLYAARIGLVFFRDIINSEEGSAKISTSEKAKVDDYLDKLELIMEERMVMTTEITKLVKGNQKKLRNVWRENFIRIAKHKKLFEGEFPDINDLNEEEEEEENKSGERRNTSTSVSGKTPSWLKVISISSLVLNVIGLSCCIFCYRSAGKAEDHATKVDKALTTFQAITLPGILKKSDSSLVAKITPISAKIDTMFDAELMKEAKAKRKK